MDWDSFMKYVVYLTECEEALTHENYVSIFSPYLKRLDSKDAVDAYFEQLQTDHGILQLPKHILACYLENNGHNRYRQKGG